MARLLLDWWHFSYLITDTISSVWPSMSLMLDLIYLWSSFYALFFRLIFIRLDLFRNYRPRSNRTLYPHSKTEALWINLFVLEPISQTTYDIKQTWDYIHYHNFAFFCFQLSFWRVSFLFVLLTLSFFRNVIYVCWAGLWIQSIYWRQSFSYVY